jgi:hypothetical protein
MVCSMTMSPPYPPENSATVTVPSAAARIGVPSGGGEVRAGVETLLAGDRVHAWPELAGEHPGALREREHHARGLTGPAVSTDTTGPAEPVPPLDAP